MTTDVIFKLATGKTLQDVSTEVNGLWGTGNPESLLVEALLPNVNTPPTVFNGDSYCRARMPRSYAESLQGTIDQGYSPQSAEVVVIQWDGPEQYLLGQEIILDENNNPVQIPVYDGEGNQTGTEDAVRDVFVGDIA